jgi:hypothetical protein
MRSSTPSVENSRNRIEPQASTRRGERRLHEIAQFMSSQSDFDTPTVAG